MAIAAPALPLVFAPSGGPFWPSVLGFLVLGVMCSSSDRVLIIVRFISCLVPVLADLLQL